MLVRSWGSFGDLVGIRGGRQDLRQQWIMINSNASNELIQLIRRECNAVGVL